MTPDNSTILRPPAAADYLTLSVQRLSRLRLEGGGPKFIKAGRSVLYRRDDLDAWLQSHIRESTSDTSHKACGHAANSNGTEATP
jgi:predicted DNA-binding transcriptional regulator AlpA